MQIRPIMLSKLSAARLSIFLFITLWFAYGAAINSSNLLEFDLQQIGVEAMVERSHFYLEGSPSPQLQTKGDVFEYRGHKYAAKQPGQFMAGAVVYFLLHKLGLDYENHYLLTAALVTFFTTSLALALSAVALLGIARDVSANDHKLLWPLAATLSYTLGTTVFAYSGIAHHDALATAYLVIAFSLISKVHRESETTLGSYLKATAAGLLLGLTITTSMLPFFMVIVLMVYFFCRRRWRLAPLFLAGLFVGLLPLFIYDTVSFGKPFRLANMAGATVFADTFWHFDPNNLGNKLVFYARALVFYVPVFVVGLFGLSYYPRRFKHSFGFLTIGVMIVLAAFILNISSDGDCQFGPRYLMPAMPFACLGLAGFSYLSTSAERRFAGLAVVLAGAASLVVNLVGALRGAMNCPHGQNAFWNQAAAIQDGAVLSYPLGAWLLLPLLICTPLFVLIIAAQRRQSRPGRSSQSLTR